jgi:hypothetical protein
MLALPLSFETARKLLMTFSLYTSPTVQRIPRCLGEFPYRELSRILCRSKDLGRTLHGAG